MVSDVTFSGVAQNATETNNQSSILSQDLDDFLNLLTVQLQNQDPLNPTDTDKLTDQITQFSQVEQQINTNQKLDDMLALQLANLSSVGLGYVGMDISYVSAELEYNGTDNVTINYALADQAETSVINIYDENGNIVYSENGPVNAGQQEFVWNGSIGDDGTTKAEPGTYSVSIDSSDSDGRPVDSTTVVSGRVRGIENQNGVIFLLVGDRAVAISNVINASTPPTDSSSQESDDTTDASGDAQDTGDDA